MANSSSMTMRTRQAKIAAKGAGLALNIAKENNDPKYAKYKKFKHKFMALKQELIDKYKGKARAKLGANF